MNGKGIFAERIDELITESKKTQKTIAEEMNISQTAISDYRRGDREPGAYALKKIAEYFGVSLDYLAGKHECKTPKKEKIMELLGLDDLAIEALKKLHRRTGGDAAISGLNLAVRTKSGINLLTLIAQYAYADFEEGFIFEVTEKTERPISRIFFHPMRDGMRLVGIDVKDIGRAMVACKAGELLTGIRDEDQNRRSEDDPHVDPKDSE